MIEPARLIGAVELIRYPQVRCPAEHHTSSGVSLFCGMEADHGGPHFDLMVAAFWQSPDEAILAAEAIRRFIPEVSRNQA